jgi:hypothetical protein
MRSSITKKIPSLFKTKKYAKSEVVEGKINGNASTVYLVQQNESFLLSVPRII